MTPTFVYRLDVEIPEGSDRYGWRPENWEPEVYDGEEWEFTWPRRRNYLSQTSADRRAQLLRSWGAKVEVLRSQPVEFLAAE